MKSIRIGAHKYPLVTTDHVDGKDDAWGMINFASMNIELSSELTKPGMESKWAEILIHEWAHGVCEEFGIKPDDEEEFVTRASKIITQALKDNKTLVRALLKALK
jgi:hypothetical protein